MPQQLPVGTQSLADSLLDRLEALLLEAEKDRSPLEVDPHRGQLFELFVMAEAAGYLEEDGKADLTAEMVCRKISQRWGLAEAARASFEEQTKLAGPHLSKMRLLWSMMRMWMEWTYAWQRWPEFRESRKG